MQRADHIQTHRYYTPPADTGGPDIYEEPTSYRRAEGVEGGYLLPIPTTEQNTNSEGFQAHPQILHVLEPDRSRHMDPTALTGRRYSNPHPVQLNIFRYINASLDPETTGRTF